MTMACIHSCLKRLCTEIGYYNGKETWPPNIAERNEVLYLYNNRLCLIWKSQGVSFKKAIEKLISDFQSVGNFITEESVSSHCEYEFITKKTDAQLTNSIIYVLEAYKIDSVIPYFISFNRLIKLGAEYNRDLI